MSTAPSPARRTFVPVTADSAELRQELKANGLRDQRLPRRVARLAHDLRMAGATSPRPERREDLRLHLRYWAAVRRLLELDWASPADLERYDPVILNLRPDRLLDRATDGAGASQVEVSGATIEHAEAADRFIVDGCRLIDVHINGVAVRYFSMEETGIFHSNLLDVEATHFTGRFCGMVGATLHAQVTESTDFTEAAARDVELTLTGDGHAVFDAADLAADDSGALRDNLHGVSPWDPARAGVRFADCRLHNASFVRTRLGGATFDRCAFGMADFSHAELENARFRQCTIGGRAMTLSDIAAAEVVSGVHIED